jgi:polysaccharide deacetylase family protein (PEP-CTERM system associated)
MSSKGSPLATRRLIHHFTVDVEEYFQVSALEPYVSRADWDRFESRVARGTERLLDLLAEYEARATFFVLGWVAERNRALVERLASSGHEVASHGWDHRRVTELRPSEFRESVRRSKSALEDIIGVPIHGYRAPSFSVVPGDEWALDILIEEGYLYDSSLFPVRRRGYGYPGGQPDPHWIERRAGRLLEVPPTTLRIGGRTLPAGGGGYFRHLPYAIIRAAFDQAERRHAPATFYIHPWELDADQPRIRVPWVTRLRHYGGLSRTIPRLRRLLSEFRFGRVIDRLAIEQQSLMAQ